MVDPSTATPRKRKRTTIKDATLPSIEVQRTLAALGNVNCIPPCAPLPA